MKAFLDKKEQNYKKIKQSKDCLGTCRFADFNNLRKRRFTSTFCQHKTSWTQLRAEQKPVQHQSRSFNAEKINVWTDAARTCKVQAEKRLKVKNDNRFERREENRSRSLILFHSELLKQQEKDFKKQLFSLKWEIVGITQKSATIYRKKYLYLYGKFNDKIYLKIFTF